MDSRCTHVKDNGEKCGALRINGCGYCFFHEPSYEKKRKEASKRGGLNRTETKFYGEPLRLEKEEDVRSLLTEVINRVWVGEMSGQAAKTFGFLARCWLEANSKCSGWSDITPLMGVDFVGLTEGDKVVSEKVMG